MTQYILVLKRDPIVTICTLSCSQDSLNLARLLKIVAEVPPGEIWTQALEGFGRFQLSWTRGVVESKNIIS